MILADWQIAKLIKDGTIKCDPFEPKNIQPASIDLRLGETLLKDQSTDPRIKLKLEGDHGRIKIANALLYEEIRLKDHAYDIQPGEFILGSTLECIGSRSPRIVSQLADKSTLARLGLSVFFSAGWIDPGNILNITLELKNHSTKPIRLLYGMHICQLVFYQLDYPVKKLYRGKYLNNTKTVGAL